MAQAERVTTAIRELMSRGGPPKSTSPRAAHIEFIAVLTGNVPHPIHSSTNSEDLERRADHLEKVLAALQVYVSASMADAAQNIPGSALDRRYLKHLLQRFSADAPSEIRDSVDEMRVRENWKVS
jgi:hypothetical protein